MKRLRDTFRFAVSVLFLWLYLPHLFLYVIRSDLRKRINADIEVYRNCISFYLSDIFALIYCLHNDRFFRNLFYHRIGSISCLFIGWWRPGDRYFVISKTTTIGDGAYFAHPYATIINAESIGRNFACRHLTTIGNKFDGENEGSRPIIGHNVTLGANVVIIGNVKIGNNVTIGAGSVVVKDIPDNSVAVGNPARVIKTLPPIE